MDILYLGYFVSERIVCVLNTRITKHYAEYIVWEAQNNIVNNLQTEYAIFHEEIAL